MRKAEKYRAKTLNHLHFSVPLSFLEWKCHTCVAGRNGNRQRRENECKEKHNMFFLSAKTENSLIRTKAKRFSMSTEYFKHSIRNHHHRVYKSLDKIWTRVSCCADVRTVHVLSALRCDLCHSVGDTLIYDSKFIWIDFWEFLSFHSESIRLVFENDEPDSHMHILSANGNSIFLLRLLSNVKMPFNGSSIKCTHESIIFPFSSFSPAARRKMWIFSVIRIEHLKWRSLFDNHKHMCFSVSEVVKPFFFVISFFISLVSRLLHCLVIDRQICPTNQLFNRSVFDVDHFVVDIETDYIFFLVCIFHFVYSRFASLFFYSVLSIASKTQIPLDGRGKVFVHLRTWLRFFDVDCWHYALVSLSTVDVAT